jgi:hypothetical protein
MLFMGGACRLLLLEARLAADQRKERRNPRFVLTPTAMLRRISRDNPGETNAQ